MIGGSDQLFEFQKQPVFVFLGLCIIGLSSGMITIPVLPEMLEAVEEDPEIANQYSMDTIQNLISGLFVSFQSIGEAIGPILSSFLTEHYGFTTS
jgi:MFS family permease